MDGQERIDEMYAFIAVDTDGTEGVPAFTSGQFLLPMMGADMSRMGDLREMAQELADNGMKVTLVKFTNRETVEEFTQEVSDETDDLRDADQAG